LNKKKNKGKDTTKKGEENLYKQYKIDKKLKTKVKMEKIEEI